LEESSLYGKVIIPWYDSDALMIAVIVAMVPVFVFALVGLVVSFEVPFNGTAAWWVPAVLAAGSLFVLLSSSVRLFRRRRFRRRPS
jgi:hypothetical protein